MTHAFEARKICDDVYWVGAVDWNLRDFHGYLTSRGTTYNAYLVMGEYVTLIDTVKAPCFDEMMSRISSIVDPSRIEYMVSNHAEMDHSGCLQRTIAAVKPSKVFASRKGIEALGLHFGSGLSLTEAPSGGSLDVGGLTLNFMDTPMLHWPDSMFTYVPQRKLLFSQDAFGMHLASYERFADELQDDVLEYEAAKYFANILMPFSKLVLNLLDKVSKSGMQLETIAPDHGPVWRRDAALMPTWYSS